METPFVFGKIASDVEFTDRQYETQHLLNNFNGIVNTVLISPRRWGKSSLVSRSAELYCAQSKDNVVVFVDLFNCRSEAKFYQEFANAVISATNSAFNDFVASALKYLSRFAPSFSVSDPAGTYEFSFGIDVKDKKMTFDEILDLPQIIAKDKGLKIVVCIDEFQTIKEYDDPMGFQRTLRAHWQKHSDVSYCLYGSKRNMMIDLFSGPKNPFYKFGDMIFLQKIAKQEWIPFIVGRFHDTGKQIPEDIAAYIADIAENHPYYVQQLSQLAWFRTSGICTKDIVDSAFEGLEAQLGLVFSLIIDSLTPTQIGFLQAVANGETSFTSQEVLNKYKLGSSANVKNIKNALEKKELIDILPDSITIQDPVFKHWLLTKY